MDQLSTILEMINARFDRLEKKVDTLENFKWKVIGFSSCTLFFGTILGWMIQAIIKKGLI